MSSGDKSILRIYGGFGRNLTRFDFDKNKVISRWSMFSNADLNIYEQLILNQPNEKAIWNISNWNFILYNDFYSGYSFFYQNDFYFVTHSNGLLNQSYQPFTVNQSDNLESVQACLYFKLQPCSMNIVHIFNIFGPKLGNRLHKTISVSKHFQESYDGLSRIMFYELQSWYSCSQHKFKSWEKYSWSIQSQFRFAQLAARFISYWNSIERYVTKKCSMLFGICLISTCIRPFLLNWNVLFVVNKYSDVKQYVAYYMQKGRWWNVFHVNGKWLYEIGPLIKILTFYT